MTGCVVRLPHGRDRNVEGKMANGACATAFFAG
jgi:hypothetical protein